MENRERQRMHAEKQTLKINVILAALEIDKSTLATELDIERTAVSKVLNLTRSNRPAREKIADALASKLKALILNEAPINGQ